MKTKEKKFKVFNKFTREELKEILNDETQTDYMKKLIDGGLSTKEFNIMFEVMRELRIEGLFEELNIDPEKYNQAKNEIIKLNPESKDLHLVSVLFRDLKGKYRLEELLNKYHDDVLKSGTIFGICYGKKFVIEDLQNGTYTIRDFKKMTKEEMIEYGDKEREI